MEMVEAQASNDAMGEDASPLGREEALGEDAQGDDTMVAVATMDLLSTESEAEAENEETNENKEMMVDAASSDAESNGTSCSSSAALCRLCGRFYGLARTSWLCSQCFKDYQLALYSGVKEGLMDMFLQRWRFTLRQAHRKAAAVYEDELENALNSLVMDDMDFEKFLSTLKSPRTLVEAVRQLPKTVSMLKSRGSFLTPTQAQRVATACLAFMPLGGSLDCLVREHVIRGLHPLVVEQWTMWLDDGRDECLWLEIGRHPVCIGDTKKKRVILPIECDWPAYCEASATQHRTSGNVNGVCVPWPVQVRNIDPCNFASIVARRKLLRERLRSFAMGLHPRLGANSPLQLFVAHPVLPELIAAFLKDDGVYDEVLWLYTRR